MRSLISFSILSLLSLFACNQQQSDALLWVNGHPVSISEFEYWMLLERAEVNSYFYREHGLTDGDDFWMTEAGGITPMEMLKERAMKEAVRCKVQQILALEKGVVKHFDFQTLMLEMEEENHRREKMIEQGEVVYGAKSFTRRSYFAHEFDLMVIQLKAALARDALKPSEKDLEGMVKNEDFPLEDNRRFYQMQYVEANYVHFIDSLTRNAEVKLNTENWNAMNAFFK